MNKIQKGLVNIWGLVIIAVLVIVVGYFVFINNNSSQNQQLDSTSDISSIIPLSNLPTSTNGAISETKSKRFIDIMQRELGTHYPIVSSSGIVSFPGQGLGTSVNKVLKGYLFEFSGNKSFFNNYLLNTLGPTRSWLTTETSTGYSNDTVVCIQYDASYPPESPRYDSNVPVHGPIIFCADYNY